MDAARRGQFITEVKCNVPICREHFLLTLVCQSFPKTQPGQFIQIACIDTETNGFIDHEFDWIPGQRLEIDGVELSGRTTTLRRPFSLAGRRDTSCGVELDFIARDVGVGTKWMSKLKSGDRVNIIGPLGNVFTPPRDGGIALMVGGGVGIPPMIYLAEMLAQAGNKAVAFCGATTRDLLALNINNNAPSPAADSVMPLYNISEFDRYGVPAVITTDDGSYGFKGFVTQALEKYLDQWITDNADRSKAVIYTCGPEIMMRRVADIAMRRNVECQVCVERAMACGMGTCQSCCLKVKKDDPAKPPLAGKDWCFRLACTDGPVFDARKLIW